MCRVAGDSFGIEAHLFDVLRQFNAEVGIQDERGYPHELLIKMGKIKV